MNINDYFEKLINKATKRLIPLQERFKVIEFINDRYFEQIGRVLPNPLINRLTSWCLKEMYSDKSNIKANSTEYPVLSIHQYKRRVARQVLFESDLSIELLNYHRNNNNLKTNKKGVKYDD